MVFLSYYFVFFYIILYNVRLDFSLLSISCLLGFSYCFLYSFSICRAVNKDNGKYYRFLPNQILGSRDTFTKFYFQILGEPQKYFLFFKAARYVCLKKWDGVMQPTEFIVLISWSIKYIIYKIISVRLYIFIFVFVY